MLRQAVQAQLVMVMELVACDYTCTGTDLVKVSACIQCLIMWPRSREPALYELSAVIQWRFAPASLLLSMNTLMC